MKHRILSTLLAFCLLLSLLPGTARAATVASGECGENGGNVIWTLDGDGALTIRGSGKMKDYVDRGTPWYNSGRAIKTVVIEKGVASIGDWAFQDCRSLTSVTIPPSVTSIGCCAFFYCYNLSSVIIPPSVTSIDYSAFAGCSRLTSVIIPNSVTSIGRHAFSGCSSLSSVTIPPSITSLEYGVFGSCSSLTSVTIPSKVTSIDGMAFKNCNSLSSVTIPSSVTYIAFQAFNGCTKLTDVYYTGSKNLWDSIKIANGNDPFLKATLHCNSGSSPQLSAPKISLTTSTTIQEGDSTSIKWNVVTGATGYLLNVKTKNTYLSKDEPISTGKLEQPITFVTAGTYEIWLKAKNASGTSAESNHINVTVVKPSISTYTLTFNANGGTCATKTKVVNANATYGTLPTPTRTGYTFTGWYTAKTGGTKISASTKASKNTTIYAHWSRVTSCIVSFDANGGTVFQDRKIVVPGGSYRELPTPTKSGSQFKGWYTKKSGGTKITEKTRVSLTADQTLYAQWTASASVKSTVKGSWKVTVPAYYELSLYTSSTSAKESSVKEMDGKAVICTQKATLNNGTVRYYGKVGTQNRWFTYSCEMDVD